MAAAPSRAQTVSDRVGFIIDKIQGEYVNASGLLSSHFPPDETHLLNDLNDYLPFLRWYGCDSFVVKQVSIAENRAKHGLMPIGNRIVSWRQDEWLGALWEQYRAEETSTLARLLKQGLEFISHNLIDRGMVKAFYNLKSGSSPSVFDPRTGALLETLLDMSAGFPEAREIALACLNQVVDWSENNQRWLIPNFVFFASASKTRISDLNPVHMPQQYLYPYVGGRRSYLGDALVGLPFGWETKLAKQNSNLVHAFIRAYELTGNGSYSDFVASWFKDFVKYMYRDGQCFSVLDNKLRTRDVKLSHNHPVIEICLEIFKVTGDHFYITLGRAIVEYWLSRRLPSGLFPAYVDSPYAFLDDQTDLVVLFVKLYKLLSEQQYLEYANDLFNTILDDFLCTNGLTRYAYASGGNSRGNSITPKYNALFLKAAIALENTDRILDDDIWMMLRDR